MRSLAGVWLALTLLLVAVAGCVDDSQPQPPGSGGTDRPTPGEEPSSESLRVPFIGARASQGAVSGGSEPIILADRAGKYLWIGDTSGGYYSTDNGTRWQSMPNFMLPGLFTDGWSFAQDARGRLYATTTQGSDVDVARSSDGGRSWEMITRAVGVSTTADRPWVAARGDAEVSLIYFDAPAGVTGFFEHCARSTDGGATWPTRNPTAGTPHTGGLVYDSKGAMYFLDSSGLMRKFSPGCTLAAQLQFFSNMGSINMLQTAIEGTDIYASTASAGNKAIVVGGTKNFATVRRITVSAPEIQSNTYPTIAVHNGILAVAWYGSETAGDPNHDAYRGSFHTYLAIVEDFWGDPVVRQYRLTEKPNHVGPICMGGVLCDSDRDLLDYFGTTFDIWGGVHVAYVHDGATSTAQTIHAHLTPDEVVAGPGGGAQGIRAAIDYEPKRPAKGEAVQFFDRSTVTSGAIVSWTWDFGNGDTSFAANPSHVFSEPKPYIVRLTVRSSTGATDQTGVIVEVSDTPGGTDPGPGPTSSDDPPQTLGPNERGSGIPGPAVLFVLAGLGVVAWVRRRSA